MGKVEIDGRDLEVGRKEVERIKEALEEIEKKRGKKRRKRRVVG